MYWFSLADLHSRRTTWQGLPAVSTMSEEHEETDRVEFNDDIKLSTTLNVDISALRLKGQKTWTPKQQCVSGVTFMELSKHDPWLVRIVNQSKRDYKEGVTCNVRFIDELVDLRTDACNQAVRDQLREGLDGPDREVKKRMRQIDKRKAKKSESTIVPSVTVIIPAAHGLAQYEMHVLYGIKLQNVFFEMTVGNIQYVLRRCKLDLIAGRKGRSSRPSPSASPRDDNDEDKGDDDMNDDNDDDLEG